MRVHGEVPRRRTIAVRIARMSDIDGSVRERVEHLSADVLWAAVKKGQSLPEDYVEHAKDCRDCREFISEFSLEARQAGFQFPDLVPQWDPSQKTYVSSR